jgi:hypothetical protein
MAMPRDVAAWFRLDRVDEVERRSLPEFFDARSKTKTPTTYMQMRNQIVQTYREAPGAHLSITECRRHLAADVGSVVRLHQFLEHWGIINNHASAEPSRSGGAGAAGLTAAPAAVNPLTLKPPTVPAASGAGSWTPAETLALLEALETAGTSGAETSWDDVATQLGRKAEECICHFLALPIAEPHASLTAPGADAAAPRSDPMLAQLALLASQVQAENGTGGAAGGAAAASARDCLSAAQARAIELRSQEAAGLSALLASTVDVQLRRLEAKLAHVDELAALLRREREQVERMRHMVVAERLAYETRRAADRAASATAPVSVAAAHLGS